MKHIVLIDDDRDLLEALTYILSGKGFHVIPYASAVGVLDKVAKRLPDVIVVDNTMPELDGATFTRQLKSKQGTRGVPVIMMSAFRHSAIDAKKAGADAFLSKPFNSADLISSINKFMR